MLAPGIMLPSTEQNCCYEPTALLNNHVLYAVLRDSLFPAGLGILSPQLHTNQPHMSCSRILGSELKITNELV